MDLLIRTCVLVVLITGILGKPVTRTHISEGPNYFVSLGSNINLTCVIDDILSPIGEVSWLHDGKVAFREGVRVTTEYGPSTVSVLQIHNATKADAGTYTCQPKQGDSAEIRVYVLDGSISVPIDSVNSKNSSCVYKGTVYPFGSHISPKEDNPCLVCECNSEEWSAADNSSCFQKECSIEENERHLDAACVPVYQAKECCPVEYYCAETILSPLPGTLKESSSQSNNQCHFAGNAYDKGMDIPVNNTCIKCSCTVPPVIQCTRITCPPNEQNCPVTHKDGECCPTYNCPQEDESYDSSTESENIYENCPTPMCADKSCRIGVPPGHQCPTCICKNEAEKDNDLEISHEKNDLEPLFEDLENPYMEIYNGTEYLDNEIPSSAIAKNFSEREFLSPDYGENSPEKEKLEGEHRNPDSPPKIIILDEEEFSLNETDLEPNGMLFEKVAEEINNLTTVAVERQKRSGNSETDGIQSSNSQQQWNIYQQDQFIDDSEDSGENSERELEGGNDDEFSEVKILSKKNAQKALDELVELDDNELENVIWTTEVAGCPAPMCADSSCRVGIPPGHTCPTCVCKKRRRQP